MPSTDASDPYLDGLEETRQDFTANDFRITQCARKPVDQRQID